MDFAGKRVLVAGGTGLIGTPLVELLLKEGARVRVAALDDASRAHPETEYMNRNLLDFKYCLEVCSGQDYVFNLLCVKGSPVTVNMYPATLLETNLLLDINLLSAAQKQGVRGFLFTSSLGVYAHAEVSHEDAVWQTMPSPNDRFAGWAKRMGELQVEAYRKQYSWNAISIVRPTNTYGPFDDFESEGAMVIPSLIRRAVSGENPLIVRGDGSEIRDFAYSEDVAKGMMLVAKKEFEEPVNLGSGIGYSIRDAVSAVADNVSPKPEIKWDMSQKAGDQKRILDIARARSIGFAPSVSLSEGIARTVAWYKENKDRHSKTRYDIFRK